jgi:signal transduction histidine kinase/ActR/RegA family two-component response regulator
VADELSGLDFTLIPALPSPWGTLALFAVVIVLAALIAAVLRRERSRAAVAQADLAAARAEAAAAQRAQHDVALEAARHRQKLEAELAECRLREEALRAAESERREEIQRRDELLATVAHELRTPLNAILGWGQVLRAGAGDEMTHALAIDAVIRNAGQQSRLISDLLDLSRVASGALHLELQPVELTAVVREALETVRPAAEAKRVRLRAVVDAEAGPLQADRHRLNQVLGNLLINAVKFTPPDGEVRVVAERDGEEVELRVCDNGSGVPEEFIPYVFEAFRQGPGRPARVHGSLGLGLTVVRRLIEAHGGCVRVQNNSPDPGATFLIRLPLHRPSAAASASLRPPFSEPDELPSLDGLRIVVVGDDPEGLELVVTVLRDRGADVSPNSSAGEALTAVRRMSPDLLVCDVAMPGEILQQLRTLPGREGGATPAVAIGGHGTSADRVRALLAGYQGYVSKPVRAAELVALVASLTDRVRISALTA